jgi:serine/threonine protein kinase
MSYEAFQAPSPESLAKLLPQYEIEFFIAQGGMGAVYKGRQRSLDRDIAIKVLPHEVGASEELRESFISEAKAMARLNHPNLLGVFDYGTVEGMPYIVMEYVSGGSLHDAAYNQAVDLLQAAAIVKSICAGLAHAHEHGIVHRDIKPSNILLTQKVEPKVADFGLAHASDWDQPGLMMGTPGYTAPEVFSDASQAGVLADIYSVGVILHQLLTGIDPAGSMEPPSQLSGSLRLDAIWRKATNVNPALRYPTVTALSADLDKWIATRQTEVAATKARSSLPSRTAYVKPVSGDSGLTTKLVVSGVLLVLIFLAYQLLKEREQESVEGITDQGGASETSSLPDPINNTESPRVPVSLPVEPEPPVFEREPIESDTSEEDETLADEDDEPEKEPEVEPEPLPSGKPEPGDPELLERAIGLIGDARKKRDKELSDNASALSFNLRVLSRDAEPDVLVLMDELKEDIVDNRIPLLDGVYGLPDEMADAFKDSFAKEESIDEKYDADLTRIRDAYVTRLKAAAADASDGNMKKRLLAQSADAADLKAWIKLLAPEPERVVRRSSGGVVGAADGGFVGNWDIHSNGNIERWIGHRDGTVEVVGQKWDVIWVILDDGTLEIRWSDKKPYIMKRDDEGWSGKASFGNPVKFTPGDW